MTTPPTTTPERARVRAAMAAVFTVFFVNGFAFANWAARIPTVQRALDLSPAQLGLILLVGSAGSIIALPMAGRVTHRLGPVRTVLSGGVLGALGMALAVAAVPTHQAALLPIGLFLAMFGIGTWDVAQNLEGARVEQALGRSVMPSFHGGYSLGTVLGAAVGTLVTRAEIPVAPHLWVTMAVMVAALAVGTRFFLAEPAPDAVPSASADAAPPVRGGFLRAWTEPRTLLIGLVVLATALTEGAANDWLALGVREGFGVPDHVGAAGLTIFLAAMTTMRFVGTWALSRFGRVPVLRGCTALAIVGLLIFGFAPTLPLALVGAVLWGLGAALGFPVGMSAASDDPARAAARLSVVSTIGYTAFLMGPALLGLIADHIGYRHALVTILVPLVASVFVLHVLRAPDGARPAVRDARADPALPVEDGSGS